MSADFLPAAAFAVTAMLLAVALRDTRREYAAVLSMLAAALLMGWGVARLEPVAERITELVELSRMQAEHAGILLKALGISVFTRMGHDLCHDAGETAIAGKVDFCGRVCLLLLALPLFEELLRLAGEILSA